MNIGQLRGYCQNIGLNSVLENELHGKIEGNDRVPSAMANSCVSSETDWCHGRALQTSATKRGRQQEQINDHIVSYTCASALTIRHGMSHSSYSGAQSVVLSAS